MNFEVWRLDIVSSLFEFAFGWLTMGQVSRSRMLEVRGWKLNFKPRTTNLEPPNQLITSQPITNQPSPLASQP